MELWCFEVESRGSGVGGGGAVRGVRVLMRLGYLMKLILKRAPRLVATLNVCPLGGACVHAGGGDAVDGCGMFGGRVL